MWLVNNAAVSVVGVSGSVGAYVAQVDHALGTGQGLYPSSLGPVGVATDLPPAAPPTPGTSGTASGAAAAGGQYQGAWQAAQGVDSQANGASTAGQAEAQTGRAAATGVRGAAQSQAAAIAPATGSPAGVRALVSAMDDKLAAMQRQLTTTQEQNRLLAVRMRQLLGAYGRMGGMGASPMGGMTGMGAGASMTTPNPGMAGLNSAGMGTMPASLASSLNRLVPQSSSQGTGTPSELDGLTNGIGTGTPLGRLTPSSTPREVAAAIINEAHKRGYSAQQTVAILSTAMQESGLRAHAVSPNRAWVGIFQQDTSYPGRGNPNSAIAEFFNRLDMKGGRHSPDIWKTIFWLQQAPGASSAEAAFQGGRQHYIVEVGSQAGRAADLYRSITGSAGCR